MSQPVTDQPAFLLQRREFKDTSLIVEIFSQQFGRLGLVAKGARKGRNAAHFQPFNRLSISWSGRSDLKTLTRIESMPLNVSEPCYLAAFYVNELLLYLLPRQDGHPRLFEAYQRLLLQLERENMEPQLRSFEIMLLTELGLMPDLLVESDSGKPVVDGGHYSLVMESGVVAGREGGNNTFRGGELAGVQYQRFDEAQVLRAARRLLRQIIDYNLQGRTLQSRKLYQQLHHKH